MLTECMSSLEEGLKKVQTLTTLKVFGIKQVHKSVMKTKSL